MLSEELVQRLGVDDPENASEMTSCRSGPSGMRRTGGPPRASRRRAKIRPGPASGASRTSRCAPQRARSRARAGARAAVHRYRDRDHRSLRDPRDAEYRLSSRRRVDRVVAPPLALPGALSGRLYRWRMRLHAPGRHKLTQRRASVTWEKAMPDARWRPGSGRANGGASSQNKIQRK
jgi:hypothetical protein